MYGGKSTKVVNVLLTMYQESHWYENKEPASI